MMKSSLIHLIFILLVLFIPNLTSAESKTFIKEYTYQASEFDSKITCRVLALEQAKRLLLEELGTYLESETEVKNFQLDKDRIIVLTAGIVKTEVIKEKWDGKSYYLVAKIKADPDKVLAAIDSLRKDRQKTKELETSRKKEDDLLQEIEIAKKELSSKKIKKGKGSLQKKKEYESKIRLLSAMDWFKIGNSTVTFAGSGYDIRSDAYRNKQKESYKYAIVAYNNAISLNKNYLEAYISRGVTYQNVGLYSQALLDFNRAIELNPKCSDAYIGRADTFAELGDFDKMMRDYDRAIALESDHIKFYMYRAHVSSKKFGRLGLEQAVKDISKVIESEPTACYFELCYNERGDYYAKLGNNDLALNDYSKTIELEPTPRHYQTRAIFYEKMSQYQYANEDYSKAIELKPNEYNYRVRAEFYEKIGQYQQAIEDYGKVISLKPKKKDGYLDRSEIYEKIGRNEDAEIDLEKVVELDPENGYLAKYWRLFDKKKYNEAIVAVNQGIELALKRNPDDAGKLLSIGFFFRSLCYYNLKNDQGALRELNEGIESQTSDLNAKRLLLYMRAKVYSRLGNIQEAIRDMNRCLDPKDIYSYAARGAIYLTAGNYSHAVKDFEKAMTINRIDGKDAIEIEIKGEGLQKGAHIRKTFIENDLDKPGKFKILLKKYPKFREKYLSTSQNKDGFSMPEPTRSNDPLGLLN